MIELTGDVTPDIGQLLRADVIVTTPEKWDGISRSWQQRAYVREIALIVIDEIHLLGEERGPVLEVCYENGCFFCQIIANSISYKAWIEVHNFVRMMFQTCLISYDTMMREKKHIE